MINLRSFSLSLYIYTLLVILWGAWVRISKSGDGCGESWPLCEGQIIPLTTNMATWIEFSHRVSTAIFGILVIILFIKIFKQYSKGHSLRKLAFWTVFFTITEALIGAKLVIFGLVGDTDSLFRLFSMSIHQVNSLLLSGVIGLIYLQIRDAKEVLWNKPAISLCLLYLALAASGGIAALSTTLFPSESLLEGFLQDFSSESHFLTRYRALHPFLALTLGSVFFYWFLTKYQKEKKVEQKKVQKDFLVLLVVSIFFGIFTLLFLSPIWMKLVHLLLAHVLFVFLLRSFLVKVIP